MKRCLLLALLLFPAVILAQPGDHYHDYYEITDFIFDIQAQHPEWVKIDSIGHSQTDELPIYLIKISNDAYTDYNRPTVLFMGQLHAEEILGIEIVLRILENMMLPSAGLWRRNLEVYLVPTMNPEGLRVVYGQGEDCVHGPDVTFRKNKRDTMGDGIFRYVVGMGGDSSGVDLNRNFDINWFAGDSLFHRNNETEIYDYYRGSAPESESEVQCIVDAIYDIRPMYSIMFHSSRSGSFSEKVMYPWDWELDGERVPPDFDVLQQVANLFANEISYEPGASGGRNGKLHDWMYAAGGWINMQTEVGTANIHPDSLGMEAVITQVMPGVEYLLERAQANPDIAGDACYLNVTVTDNNGTPMVAEVRIPTRTDGYLAPRYTDAEFGAYRRPLLHGTYEVQTRAWGYETDVSTVVLSSDFITNHNVTLQPLPTHTISMGIYDGEDGPAMPGRFVIHRPYGIDTVDVANGFYVREWPAGDYVVEAWADGYLPRRYELVFTGDYSLHASLVQPVSSVTDDFEGGDVPENWSWEGDFDWGRSDLEAHSGTISLESNPGHYIEEGDAGYAMVAYSVPQDADYVTLTGWRCYELEPDDDYCYVDVRYDRGDWQNIEALNGFSRWQPFFYTLDNRNGATEIDIRWYIETDGTDIDRGLFPR